VRESQIEMRKEVLRKEVLRKAKRLHTMLKSNTYEEGKMKKLFIVSLIVLFALGFAFDSYAKPKGTLTVAVPDFGYESFDPIVMESFWGWTMYDPLITYDPKGNVIGSIAESWTLSPDGNTWTFKIRKGVKFHNGDPCTSADVAFSVVRFSGKDSTNPWSPYLRRNFAGVETPDDYTFVYKTNKPEPQLITVFAWTRILPKNYIEKNGIDHFKKNPVGTGPYMFDKFVSETSMEMKANSKHWRIKPAFAKIKELQIPEEATRIAMLKRGDVDIITALSYDSIVMLRDEGFTLQSFGLPTLANINFAGTWMTDGPTSDIRVRKAMSYAINRQELCDTYFKGLAKPGCRWFMDEHTWGWDPNWKADPYDKEKALALLKEAGYPDKFKKKTIDIYVTAAGYTADLMQILQGYWAEVGIKVDIKVVDANVWGGMVFVRKTDPSDPYVGAIWPWVFGGAFNNVYHSANLFTSKGVHTTANDPKADELYAKAANELDPEKGKQYWTEFMNYAYDVMWVNVGIVNVPAYAVMGPRVGKVTSNAHLSLWDAYAGIQHK
jgi:peptide/nickel transport system substrate-binding protein